MTTVDYSQVIGQKRKLANGAMAGYFNAVTKDGKPTQVFRIIESSSAALDRARAARKNPRQISQQQAQDAFDRFYARTRTIKRGPRKGQPRYKSPRGRKAARTYDKNHTGKKVISDARYLHSPQHYDFLGVDTGPKPRKALTQKQIDNLKKGQAIRKAKLAAARRGQVGGYWW